MAGVDPRPSGRIFISYRREETAYPAGWLADRIAERFGRGSVFKDVDSIAFGDDFTAAIAAAVGSCDVLLALIGPRWVAMTDQNGRRRLDLPDDFVRREIETALARNVRVIPILVDGARMPTVDELPHTLSPLTRRQALDVNPSRFASDTARLIAVLERTLREQRASHAVPDGSATAPRDRRRLAIGAGAVVILVAAVVVVVTSRSGVPGIVGSTTPTTAPAAAPPSASDPAVATNTPTAGAAATPPGPTGRVLLSEDFSAAAIGWAVMGSTASGGITDGAYRLEVAPQPNGTGGELLPERVPGLHPNAPADVVIETTTTRLSAETPMDNGVTCRWKEGDGYFLVLSQGAAEINKYSAAGGYKQLERTPLPFDVGGPHRLTAECRDEGDGAGVHLSLKVDGQLLVDHVDSHPLTEGRVGLCMGLHKSARSPGVARFDDVTVWG